MTLLNPSRAELISWANTVTKGDIKSLEQLSDGQVFSQILNLFMPGSINLKKLNKRPFSPLQKVKNLKIFQIAMSSVNMQMNVDIIGISEKKVSAILQLLQFLYRKFKSTPEPKPEPASITSYIGSLVKRPQSKGKENNSLKVFGNRSKSHGSIHANKVTRSSIVGQGCKGISKDDGQMEDKMKTNEKRSQKIQNMNNISKKIAKEEKPFPEYGKFNENGKLALTVQDLHKIPNFMPPGVSLPFWEKKLIKIIGFVRERHPESERELNDLLGSKQKDIQEQEINLTTQKRENQYITVSMSANRSENTSMNCEEDSHLKGSKHSLLKSKNDKKIELKQLNSEEYIRSIREHKKQELKQDCGKKESTFNPEQEISKSLKMNAPIQFKDAIKHFSSKSSSNSGCRISTIFGEQHLIDNNLKEDKPKDI